MTQKTVRMSIWVTQSNMCRLEFDKKADGTFRGIWCERETLTPRLKELLPGISPEKCQQIHEKLDVLAQDSSKRPQRFLTVVHKYQQSNPIQEPIHEFQI